MNGTIFSHQSQSSEDGYSVTLKEGKTKQADHFTRLQQRQQAQNDLIKRMKLSQEALQMIGEDA